MLFAIRSEAKEIVLIRHAKVDLETKGWMSAQKAKCFRTAYDTAAIHNFLPDTVLSKIPNRITDTVYTSSLPRSLCTAFNLFDDSVIYYSTPFFDEFELHIIRLPLVLPYKAWTAISRFGWFVGFKREHTETHKEARRRVKHAVNFIEEKSRHNEQVILVTHGFLNHKIKNKLKRRGWRIKHDQGKENLGATVLEK